MRKAQSSMEYIMMIAGILVIVVLIAFVVMTLLNKQTPTEQAVQEKMNQYILSPSDIGCAKYTDKATYQTAAYSTDTWCLCYQVWDRCKTAQLKVAGDTGVPGSPCNDPSVCP